MSRTEKALATVAAVLCVVIVAGTAFALLTGTPSRKAARLAVPPALAASGVYDGIGRIRAATVDDPPAVVVVHVAFPYDASDRAFREELAAKRDALRRAAVAFFSAQAAKALQPSREAVVKAALRDELNAMLVLGAIEELFFAEFQVIR